MTLALRLDDVDLVVAELPDCVSVPDVGEWDGGEVVEVSDVGESSPGRHRADRREQALPCPLALVFQPPVLGHERRCPSNSTRRPSSAPARTGCDVRLSSAETRAPSRAALAARRLARCQRPRRAVGQLRPGRSVGAALLRRLVAKSWRYFTCSRSVAYQRM